MYLYVLLHADNDIMEDEQNKQLLRGSGFRFLEYPERKCIRNERKPTSSDRYACICIYFNDYVLDISVITK